MDCIMELSPNDRMEQALAAPNPDTKLFDLARALRDEGMAQESLYALFDAFRERHAHDTDETLYEALLDTLDCILGWCAPRRKLYGTWTDDTVPPLAAE
jgi:hypothetical protein